MNRWAPCVFCRNSLANRQSVRVSRYAAGALMVLVSLVVPTQRTMGQEDKGPLRQTEGVYSRPPNELNLNVLPKQELRPKQWFWSGAEELAVLLGGTVWYWRNMEFNSQDWDLAWDQESWKKKLITFEALRFDSNDFYTNSVSHSRAGTVYYHAARENGLTAGESVMMNAAATLLWEYAVEFKEVPSINDMLVNVGAGWAIGEPMYQLSQYFRRGRSNKFNRVMAYALSPFGMLDDSIHHRSWHQHDGVDDFGMSTGRWHRFEIGMGTIASNSSEETASNNMALGFDAALVMLKGYERPFAFSQWTAPGTWTGLRGFWAFANQDTLTAARFSTDVSVLGHYTQAFSTDDRNELRGFGMFLGLGSGFDYNTRYLPGRWDRATRIDLIGPRFEWVAAAGGLKLRLHAAAALGFAMVDSLPFKAQEAQGRAESRGDMKSTLGAYGYYYSRSLSTEARLALEYRWFDFRASGRLSDYSSIQGRDRFEERTNDEYLMFDRRTTLRFDVGVRPAAGPFRISGRFEQNFRKGQFNETTLNEEDRQALLGLGVVF
jgi:hypothetical protein